MKAILVGGGIGGLTAALALDQIGWDVSVLERAPELGEIGAGVQISPNGIKVLDALGVMPRIEATLFQPDAIEIRHGPTGRKFFHLPMKAVALERWGARYIQIHRADLVDGLAATLRDRQPDALRTGAEVAAYETSSKGAAVTLTTGERCEADLIIGADGIHSVIRDQMLGPDEPVFTGNVAWRAVVPVADLDPDVVPPPSGCVWTGPGKHAVTTRIRGGSVVNFVGVVEQDAWTQEGWSLTGTAAQAHADFGGWNPTLAAIIDAAPTLHRWALFTRPPLPRWSDGAVALLGDAAHPMLPSMAQGAVQAMEDAFVLARELEKGGMISAACERYYAARIDRVTRVQEQSAANLALFHRRGVLSQLQAYAPIWLAGKVAPRLLQRRNDWLYGAELG
ncbi:monooxygenase [Pseudaestuariivita atlantica]|uniref:Monooxygenase n=1 Tax=Pseudaestuariivita atlantica TaxID=1317121 RepID=A0A0L1JRD7_9RHOB|nr:monooxygenase [Pseudaestuariivita atlantica]